MEHIYIAVVADIIRSRDISDRKGLQQKLNSAFKQINTENPSILSPFTLTLGDEFQAVFKSSNNLFLSLLQVIDTLFPHELRIGVGIDSLSTDINHDSALGMDGPAFHKARAAVELLKKTSAYCRVESRRGKYDLLISSVMDVIIGEIFKYKKSNRSGIYIGKLQGKSDAMIGEEEHISRQAVNKNVQTWMVDQKVAQIMSIQELIEEELWSR